MTNGEYTPSAVKELIRMHHQANERRQIESGALTDEQIDRLIAARAAITDRTDSYPNWRAVDLIDAVLCDVPAGQRNDVDLLLGRTCVVPTPREALRRAAAEVGAKAEWLTPQEVAQLDNAEMVRIAADAIRNQPPIEY